MATVLVVDDDIDVLDTLAAIVRARGPSGLQDARGGMAPDVLDGDAPIDLLVTDVIMPGLNGFNLARMARMRRSALRVLYLTGFSEEALAMRDGGDHYGKMLIKPLLPADLRKEINAALS